MEMKYFAIALLWIGYCALHSYLISIRVSRFMSGILKDFYAFYRFFYIVVSFVLLVPLINFTSGLDHEVIIHYGFYVNIVRYILIYGSLLMFFWTFFINYDSLSFFGIRQIIGFKKPPNESSPGDIRKNGMLGIIRHPMYLALIIYLWCQTFSLANIVVNVILTIYIIIGTRLEEEKLVLEFGEAYKRYKKEVPMLIPFTKRKSK
jgi:methanethiol S-methyltransferase